MAGEECVEGCGPMAGEECVEGCGHMAGVGVRPAWLDGWAWAYCGSGEGEAHMTGHGPLDWLGIGH